MFQLSFQKFAHKKHVELKDVFTSNYNASICHKYTKVEYIIWYTILHHYRHRTTLVELQKGKFASFEKQRSNLLSLNYRITGSSFLKSMQIKQTVHSYTKFSGSYPFFLDTEIGKLSYVNMSLKDNLYSSNMR